jgi:hypothetical protein
MNAFTRLRGEHWVLMVAMAALLAGLEDVQTWGEVFATPKPVVKMLGAAALMMRASHVPRKPHPEEGAE